MARPSLTKHRKFRRLSRVLGSDVLALGHLEWLWMTAYEDGNDFLGDADDVEAAAHWLGPAGGLTDALLTCGGPGHAGFIEARDGAYHVHDLYDHAPQYVSRRAAREQSRRANGPSLASQRLVNDVSLASQQLVNGQPVSSTPAPAPAPAPKNKSASRPHEDAPKPAPAPVPPVRALWDAYRDAAEAVGHALPLEPSGKDSEHLRVLAHSYRLDELSQALAAWWASPHIDRRYLGSFRADVGDVLAHVASQAVHPFRAPARPGPRPAPAPTGGSWRDRCPHTPPCSTPTRCELAQVRAQNGAVRA